MATVTHKMSLFILTRDVLQKHPFGRTILKNFAMFTGKKPVIEFVLDNVAGLKGFSCE